MRKNMRSLLGLAVMLAALAMWQPGSARAEGAGEQNNGPAAVATMEAADAAVEAAMDGSWLGPITSRYIPDIWLKRLFIVIAFIVGINYVLRGFFGRRLW